MTRFDKQPKTWRSWARRLAILMFFGTAIGLLMLPQHYPGFMQRPVYSEGAPDQPLVRETRPEQKQRLIQEAAARVAQYKKELPHLAESAGAPPSIDERVRQIPVAKPIKPRLPKDFTDPSKPVQRTRVLFKKATPPDEPNPFDDASASRE